MISFGIMPVLAVGSRFMKKIRSFNARLAKLEADMLEAGLPKAKIKEILRASAISFGFMFFSCRFFKQVSSCSHQIGV